MSNHVNIWKHKGKAALARINILCLACNPLMPFPLANKKKKIETLINNLKTSATHFMNI